MTLGRELLQIVEVDLDYCDLTYGTGACRANLGVTGARKCFNSYATCQSKADFVRVTKTLRFSYNQDGLPRQTIFPCLRSYSTNPTMINTGGVGGTVGPLGKRARVTVTLQDFTYHDTYLDKYYTQRISGAAAADGSKYTPETRGTFFGKLRARFPYYQGRNLRIREGYVGDNLGDLPTRHYVIEEWSGPDENGTVTITAKDILSLAENDKALCPPPSRGRIREEIDETDSLPTITLVPETIGVEYPASGRALIGSEIVSYTRSGDLVTITGRGLDGSEASTHDADDSFQECFRVETSPIHTVVRDLLRDYADTPSAYIPFSQWTSESERWLAGFNLTCTVTKPTGVAKLVGEILQLGATIWWDDVAQKIGFRANRPVDVVEGEEALQLNDDQHIIQGSLQNTDEHEKRLTKVLLWHGVIDYSQAPDSSENFKRLLVSADTDAESANQYTEERVFEIYSRWLGNAGDDTIAGPVAGRLVRRYRDTPRTIKLRLDQKDRTSLEYGALADLTTRILQDDTGASVPTRFQIAGIEDKIGGHVVEVTFHSFDLSGKYGFIVSDSAADYGSATDAAKLVGAWIAPDDAVFSDGSTAYLMY